MEKVSIAGLSLGGSRKDNFFFCLLEYYSDSKRWFLKSILHIPQKGPDGATNNGNNVLREWASGFNIKHLVVDFPLSSPPCYECGLSCPGMEVCPVDEVIYAKGRMDSLLKGDQELYRYSPKDYEQKRCKTEDTPPSDSLLSKAFKRKLRKGFLPYWNRSVDVWVWENYYDHLLAHFNVVFDSFGNTSVMLMSRFAYLKRHLPPDLTYYETSPLLCLLELLRGKIVSKNHILQLKDLSKGARARLTIVKAIETKLKIFIYDHDLDLMTKNPKAFESFLLALTGQRVILDEMVHIPSWCLESSSHFIVPKF